jgi:hypothetical protein
LLRARLSQVANPNFCAIHRANYTGETCPWCTMVPVEIIRESRVPKVPYELTERERRWLRDECGIDPDR